MKAYEFLEGLGWNQGCYGYKKNGSQIYTQEELKDHDSIQSVCLLGAVKAVYDSDFEQQEATAKVSKAIGDYVGFIFDWNDEPGRTKEEVVDILRRADV